MYQVKLLSLAIITSLMLNTQGRAQQENYIDGIFDTEKAYQEKKVSKFVFELIRKDGAKYSETFKDLLQWLSSEVEQANIASNMMLSQTILLTIRETEAISRTMKGDSIVFHTNGSYMAYSNNYINSLKRGLNGYGLIYIQNHAWAFISALPVEKAHWEEAKQKRIQKSYYEGGYFIDDTSLIDSIPRNHDLGGLYFRKGAVLVPGKKAIEEIKKH